MRAIIRTLTTTHVALIALCWVGGVAAADETVGVRTPATPMEPSVTVLPSGRVLSVLGREARGSANENMGRVVDVIVDGTGRVRAAVIDFGGFLGVGSRKVAVAWNVLRFPAAEQLDPVIVELTRDQVRLAPEYRLGEPIVVLGSPNATTAEPPPRQGK